MRRDPMEVLAEREHEEYEDGVRNVRATLTKVVGGDLAEALSAHASWFMEYKVFGEDRKEYYDGRRMNATWVVRTKEINMIATLAPVAGAIAAIAGPASAVVALLSAVAGLMHAFSAKKIELGERDFALLMFLKAHGPIRQNELLAGLNSIRASTQFTWHSEGMASDLARLQKVTLGDGTVDALVAQAADERWSANGV